MADENIFPINVIENIDISRIILIQAWFRGLSVRRSILGLRTEYEDVMSQIEKGKTQHIQWKSNGPCKPKIVAGRPISKATKTISCKHQPVTSKPQHSVEVQTSFIDLTPQMCQPTNDNIPKPTLITSGMLKGDTSSEVCWKDRVEPFLCQDFEAADIPLEHTGHELNTPDQDLQLTLPMSSSDSEVSFNSDDNKSAKQKRSARSSSTMLKSFNENTDRKVENIRPGVPVQHSDNTNYDEHSKRREGENHMKPIGDRAASKSAGSQKAHYHEDPGLRSEGREASPVSHSVQSPRSKSDMIPRSQRSKDIVTHRSHSSDQGQITPRSDRSARSYTSEQGGRSQRSIQGESSQRSYESERSQRSNLGNRSQRSNQGERSQRSNEGERSQRSDHGNYVSNSERDHVSSRSSHGQSSSRSNKSQSSAKSGGPSEANTCRDRKQMYKNERMSPRHVSSKSIVAREPVRSQPGSPGRSKEHGPAGGAVGKSERPVQTGKYTGNSTSLTNVTSVWDSFSSDRGVQETLPLPDEPGALQEVRRNVAMELLWVQQAIDSRKNYLRLKGSI